SSTSRNRTAADKIEAALLGRPSNTPSKVSDAITPARITDGSAPVSTTKKTTVPSPRRNRGHRVSRSASANPSIGASTIATFSPGNSQSIYYWGMTTVVIYARLSQRGEEKDLRRQLRLCRQRAADEGWSVVGEYVDNGVSGWKRGVKRREYERLLA